LIFARSCSIIVQVEWIAPDRERGEPQMTNKFGLQIGEFVRLRRKASGFTQGELGDLAGVGRRFVSELEMAKPTLRLNSVNKVLTVFGKTLGIVDAPKDESL
jgi:y4mF family transcriptional regulator